MVIVDICMGTLHRHAYLATPLTRRPSPFLPSLSPGSLFPVVSEKLNQAALPIVPFATCSKPAYWWDTLRPSMICAGYESPDELKSACQVDYGPLPSYSASFWARGGRERAWWYNLLPREWLVLR